MLSFVVSQYHVTVTTVQGIQSVGQTLSSHPNTPRSPGELRELEPIQTFLSRRHHNLRPYQQATIFCRSMNLQHLVLLTPLPGKTTTPVCGYLPPSASQDIQNPEFPVPEHHASPLIMGRFSEWIIILTSSGYSETESLVSHLEKL